MARVAENLVGRAAEIAVIDEALDRLAERKPDALLLLGEPGIGKSRLLRELAERADARGAIVLSGSASELEVDLPFWVFVDALDEYAAGLEPRRLARLEPDVRAELARVLPSLSDLGDPTRVAVQDERYRAHRAVRELLQQLAATKPLVLVLDDLHWADSASMELLGGLLRQPPTASVLLALAARPRQLPERIASALERAARAGSLTRIELARLTREDAGLLLGDEVKPGLADALFEESGGNPFYLEQLSRTSRANAGDGAAHTPLPDLAGLDVPPAVAAALAEELGLLPDAMRVVLQGAAVAGDPFEPELAAAAAHVDEDAATNALDELLARDLVRPTDVPRRFRFRHPLVRRVVYESSPGGWRLGAHDRCAAALAGRGASAAVRAHHVEHAARPGDADALALLREAGEASSVRAPASAARWFGSALRLLPDNAPAHERVGLLLARARALGAIGRVEDSRGDLLECISLVRDEPPAVRVKLIVACAGAEHMLGRFDEAHARLTSALEQLPDPDAPEATTLWVTLALDGVFRGELDAARGAGRRGLELARKLGDPALTAAPAAVLALCAAFAGDSGEAQAARDEAAPVVDAMPDGELAAHIDAAAHLAMAELYLDRFEESGAHAERARVIGRATGQHFPTLIPTLATVQVMQGKPAEAIETIDAGVEAARLAANPQDIAWALHIRSAAALAAGDVDTALRAAEEARGITAGMPPSFVTAYPALALASALFPAGDPAGAVRVLVDGSGGERLPMIPGSWRAHGFELLAACNGELGRHEDATRAAAHAQEWAAALRLPSAETWARRAAATVALADGRPGPAAEHALAASRAAESVGMSIEAAHARALAGRALAAAGDADAAAAELERAAVAFEAADAPRYREGAERELRKLGRHVHRRSRPGSAAGAGIDSLSERELEVARLVVDRRTNREIAAALFVSLKTVEAHMRNLFRKLEVTSRVEVARAVERAERDPDPRR